MSCRGVSSLSQAVDEMKRLLEVYQRDIGHTPEILALALSSRKNLCIHPEVCAPSDSSLVCGCVGVQVSREEEGKLVDSKCHQLTASFVRDRHSQDSSVPVCMFYEVSV